MRLRGRLTLVAAIAASALALTACSSSGTTTEETSSASADGEWPRTVTHELGDLTLEAAPERIVSTSPSVTGTLLAMDAPVIATAATTVSDITDDKGFFSQWADVADEKGVEVLYDNLEFDLEALIAAEPDLVVVSTSGADSVADHYDEIAELFPTIAVDYSGQSWQDLATQLGDAIGDEDGAEAAIDDFDEYSAAAAEKIEAPEGGIAIASWGSNYEQIGVGKTTGPQADVFEALGITVNEADESLDASEQPRDDFAFVAPENTTAALSGDAIFLLAAGDDVAAEFMADPTLQNLDAVKSGSVYGLGLTSFRVDYYSGKAIIDVVVGVFGA